MLRFAFLMLFLFAFTLVKAQQVGDKMEVPSIDLENMEGQQVDLKDYATNGKITIISFWATWCKPCKKELSNLKYLLPEWKENYDVELVAISIDNSRTSRKVESFVNGERWQFDVLLDDNQKTKRALNFSAIPYSMIINKEGKVAYKHSGYKEGDEYKMEDQLKAMNRENEENEN